MNIGCEKNPPNGHDMNEQNARIADIITTLLRCIHVKGEVEEEVWFDTPFFVVKTEEAPLLIGDRGQNLEALSHIVRKIAEKNDPAPKFVLDVNGYMKKHFEELRDRAFMGAERVKYFKKEVILQPMSSLERRVIHMTLQNNSDIMTESAGYGVQRHVVIKLRNLDLANIVV